MLIRDKRLIFRTSIIAMQLVNLRLNRLFWVNSITQFVTFPVILQKKDFL